ncbi:MAG: virulence factor SrfC family protein [Pseudomonadota bacterium]
MTTQDQLVTRCSSVAEASTQAQAWISDDANTEMVGPNYKSLTQMLRRATRRAQKLNRAAQTRMSVSVFGPSQAGKSFLVSVLARPENGSLTADFADPDGKMDYISQINPEGEGESTGLVTRFTMSKDPTPPGFPIKLQLLSEADIVRTVLNSFYMDGDQSEPAPEPEDISAHLTTFRAKMGAVVPGITSDDMMDIADYVNNTSFGKTAYAAALKSFWEDAGDIAPNLSLEDRGQFFQFIWGGHEALTQLYVKLAKALALIGNASEVHVPLSALTPRETSIIDVKTLGPLMSDDVSDTLPMQTPAGATVNVPRAAACALAAELVMPMLEQPSPVFAETDLLDFPGARNRFERPLSETLRKPEVALTQLLLRGKVAYLFDRYVENQEITSMLLCVPDSNMETLDLPDLVENWIALTHGNRPEQRKDVDCILFFVMTKFDKHLGESAGSGDGNTRFQRRMEASLDSFGRIGKSRDPWIDEWTPGTPFKNCYWLRNPNFFVEGLINYDADNREVEIRPEKADRMDELRTGYLEAPMVQDHFASPEAAWDAALSLNDGGVSYLIGNLAKVCKPDSKIRQIKAQVDKVAHDVAMAMGNYHVSDDVEKRIEEKRIAAGKVIDALESALNNHRFGAVLNALMVGQDQIQDQIARVPPDIRISSAVSSATGATSTGASAPSGVTTRPALRPGAVRPGAIRPGAPAAATPPPQEEAAPEEDTKGRIRTMTPESFQAETAIEVWIEALKGFKSNLPLLDHLGFTEEAANDLVNEMITSLRRINLADEIEAKLKSINFGHTVDKQAQAAAIVCAERINDFVTRVGTGSLPEKDRPVVELGDGQTRKVFALKEASDTPETLPIEPVSVVTDTWTDWVFALDAMFVANAKDTGGGEVDIEQNLRIGKILNILEGREDA